MSLYIDTSTGLKVQVLEGPGNYSKWLHDLKYVAVCKDAWVLISPSSFPENDREDIISKPKRPTKPDLSQFNYQINVVPSDGDATAKQQIFRTEYNNYRIEISEYELDAKSYFEQQERLRNARTLLLSTVHPTICDSISNRFVPSEIMAAIQSLCKPNVHQQLPGTVQPEMQRPVDRQTALPPSENEHISAPKLKNDSQPFSRHETSTPVSEAKVLSWWLSPQDADNAPMDQRSKYW
jgi:hypothetical protein